MGEIIIDHYVKTTDVLKFQGKWKVYQQKTMVPLSKLELLQVISRLV